MSINREPAPPRRNRSSGDTPRPDLTQLTPSELLSRIRALQSRVDELAAENELLRTRKTRTRVLANARQLQTLFDAIRDGICLLDWNGRILRCNHSFQEFLGKKEEEIVGRFYSEVMRAVPSFVEAFPIGQAGQMRRRVGIDLSIADRWYSVTIDPLLDDKGESSGAVCVIREVTARKTSEQELRESERRLRLATGQVPAILWTTDTQLRFTSSNGAGLAALGLSPNQVVGMDLFEYFKTEDRKHVAIVAHRGALAGESSTYEMEVSGHVFRSHVEPLRNLEGTITGTIGIAQDVTEIRHAGRALAESEKRFREMFEGSPVGIALADRDRRFITVNAAFARMLGYTTAEMVGMRAHATTHPDDREATAAAARRAFEHEGVTAVVEKRSLRKDGSSMWGKLTLHALRDSDGNFLHFLGMIEDITERRRTEAALKEAEERFRRVYEGAPIGITVVNAERRVLMANPAFCRMLGYTVEELQGVTFLDLTHPDDREASIALQAKAHAAGEAPVTLEKRYITRGGQTLWVRITVRDIHDADGQFLCWLTMTEDITQRKALEGQLRHSQKMEAVGRIAGAVAHDFNNMLTAIKGYVDLIGKGREDDKALVADVQSIHGVLTRAAELTRQLLALGSRSQQRVATVDLDAIVTNLLEMLRRLVGSGVNVTHSSDPDLRGVRADPGQVEQVLMNLAMNARDAMPDGGTLSIETRNVDFDEEYAARHVDVRAGRYVLLSVRDTGVGMDAEVQARLFEPYFTTKSSGTGLGLSTVYGAVKQSGGHVAVESAPGKGTTFRIWLPAVPR